MSTSKFSQLRLELDSLRSRLNEDVTDSSSDEPGNLRVRQEDKFVAVHEDAAGQVKPSFDTASLLVTADPACEFSSHQWLVYLSKACALWEKDGRPALHFTQLCGLYKKALESVPEPTRSSSSDCAQLCVDYIRLKAFHDPAQASVLFSSACETFKQFAFVHVAAAQFALSKDCPMSASMRSRSEVSRSLLLRGLEVGAIPCQLLRSALQTLSEATQKLQEENKENLVRGFTLNEAAGLNSNASLPLKAETEEKATSNIFGTGRNQIERSPDTSNMAQDVPPHARPRHLECRSESIEVDPQHGGLQEKHTLQSDTGMQIMNLSSANCEHTGPSKGRVSDCGRMESDAGQQERGSSIILGISTLSINFSSSLSTRQAMRVPVSEQQRVLNQEIDLRETSVGLAMTTQSFQQANVSHLDFAFPEPIPSVSSQASPSIMEAQAPTDDHQPLLNNSEGRPGFKRSSSSSLLSQGRRLSPCPTPCLTSQPLQCVPTPASLPFVRIPHSSTPSLSKPFIACPSTPAHDQQPPPSKKSSLGGEQVQKTCSSNPLLYQPMAAQQKGNKCISVNGKTYRILKLLGQGGTSKVYQVYDAQAEEVRAMKCVRLDTADPLIREAIAKEIQFLEKLQSCSDMIIRLYSHEMTDSCVLMVMECGSIDLNSWLNMERKRLKPEDRSFYWRNMVEAVSAIHKQGVVHTDLKPANFLFVKGRLKLIDFGIANSIQADATSFFRDSRMGTLNFMAPETIEDYSDSSEGIYKVGPKSDVWALGCILFLMTFGYTPFQKISKHFQKLHAIIDPSHEITFPPCDEPLLMDVLKRSLIRNAQERISVEEILTHPYLKARPSMESLKPNSQNVVIQNAEVRRLISHIEALSSPNSITRMAKGLIEDLENRRK